MKTKLLLLSTIFFFKSSLFSQSRSTESIGFNDITVIELGTHNDIWYGTDGHGFANHNLSDGHTDYFDLNTAGGIPSNSTVTAITLDSVNGSQFAFVSTNNGVVYRMGANSWQRLDAVNINDAVMGSFVPHTPDTLYVVQKNNGLVKYNLNGSVNFVSKITSPYLKNITCTLRSTILCDTGLMVGTSDTGVVWTKDFNTYHYINTKVANQGLVDDRVNTIRLDNNCGAVYVGTKNGFSKCPVGVGAPPCFNLNHSNNPNFPGNDVTAIEIGCDGKLWVGTRDSGIVVFDLGVGPPPAPASVVITRIAGLVSDSITVLKLDSACNILAGATDGNISEISKDSLKLMDTLETTSTAVQNINAESFNLHVYPQPSANQINFVSEKEIVNGKFLLTDITGRTLQQFSLGTTNHFAADVSSIGNGIYFYQILSDNKLVKAGKVEVLK